MKKPVLVLLSIVTVCFLWVHSVAATTHITFWHPWGPGTSHSEAVKEVVELFHQCQDEIRVTPVAVGGSHEERDKFLVAVAGGTPPDVAIMGGLDVEWILSGVYQPLTAFLEKDGITAEDFFPGVYEAMRYGDDFWVVPFETFLRTWQLIINTGHFETAGLDPNAPPATIFDMETLDRKLTLTNSDGVINRVGVFPFQAWGYWNALSQWTYQWGSDFYDQEKQDVAINTPRNVDVLTWLFNWYQRVGHEEYQRSMLQGSFHNPEHLFATERVSMSLWIPGWDSIFDRYQVRSQIEYRNVWLPHHPDVDPTENIVVVCDWAYSIPAGSPNPEAAWEFIKFCTTDPEAAMLWGERLGILTVGINNPFPQVMMERPNVYGTFMEYLQYAKAAPPPVQGVPGLGSYFEETLPLVYEGKLLPDEALRFIEEQVRRDMELWLAE